MLANGNQIADNGGYLRADGTEGDLVEVTGDLADIDLADNPFDCEFIGSIPLIERAGVLPDLKSDKSLVATSLWRRRTRYPASGWAAAHIRVVIGTRPDRCCDE